MSVTMPLKFKTDVGQNENTKAACVVFIHPFLLLFSFECVDVKLAWS